MDPPLPQQREREVDSCSDGTASETASSSEGWPAADEAEPSEGGGAAAGHVQLQVARRKDYEKAWQEAPLPQKENLNEEVAITVTDEKAGPPPKVKLWMMVDADRELRADLRYHDRTGQTDDDAIIEALLREFPMLLWTASGNI